MLEITGQDCYEFGGVPPFNRLKWHELPKQEKEAWEALARGVVADLEKIGRICPLLVRLNWQLQRQPLPAGVLT